MTGSAKGRPGSRMPQEIEVSGAESLPIDETHSSDGTADMASVRDSGYGKVCAELGLVLDPVYTDLALTHRSYAYEHGAIPHNERLEFLGDAVLGLVVTDKLYRDYPHLPEGQLAKIRAAVVNARSLAEVARELGIGPLIKLGKGELASGGQDKSSILADTMEALLGAIHLTNGLAGATGLIVHLFGPVLRQAASLGAALDWKTSIQELAVQSGYGPPVYQLTDSGPDHDKTFRAYLVIGPEKFGPGIGRSKKDAEQKVAKMAFEGLSEKQNSAPNRNA